MNRRGNYTGSNVGMKRIGCISEALNAVKISNSNNPNENPKKISSTMRQKANKDLGVFCKEYYPTIPVTELFDLLGKYGIVVLQEDGTEFSGFFSGEKGRATIDIGLKSSKNGEFYTPFDNCLLVLTWYKISNNYEIVAYIS
jgi:hypothetical protein